MTENNKANNNCTTTGITANDSIQLDGTALLNEPQFLDVWKGSEELDEGEGTIVDQLDPTSTMTSKPPMINQKQPDNDKERTNTPFNQCTNEKNMDNDNKIDNFSERGAQGGMYVLSTL